MIQPSISTLLSVSCWKLHSNLIIRVSKIMKIEWHLTRFHVGWRLLSMSFNNNLSSSSLHFPLLSLVLTLLILLLVIDVLGLSLSTSSSSMSSEKSTRIFYQIRKFNWSKLWYLPSLFELSAYCDELTWSLTFWSKYLHSSTMSKGLKQNMF